jgi:hypothetical protein
MYVTLNRIFNLLRSFFAYLSEVTQRLKSSRMFELSFSSSSVPIQLVVPKKLYVAMCWTSLSMPQKLLLVPPLKVSRLVFENCSVQIYVSLHIS